MSRARFLATALAIAVLALLIPTRALAAPGEGSFAPSSVIAPISRIYLASGTGTDAKQVVLYECTGSAAECAVDLADQAALDKLFAKPVSVPVGSYDTIGINCVSATMRVKGTVDLGALPERPGAPSAPAATYRTVAAGGITSAPGEPEYVDIATMGCIPHVRLPKPLEVREGEVVDLSAVFTLRDVAWARASATASDFGNCIIGSGGVVCIAFPTLVIFPTAGQVRIEAYLVSEIIGAVREDAPVAEHRDRAGAQILFLVGADGEPFGGWLRPYYSQTSVRPNGIYHTALKPVAKNPPGPGDDGRLPGGASDGGAGDASSDAGALDASAPFGPPMGAASYAFESFGNDMGSLDGFRLRFERFYRSEHYGFMLQESVATKAAYLAFAR
jgi:hypothetical protein